MGAKATAKPVNPASHTDFELEQALVQEIRQAAPEVIRRVIAKASDGSYLHAKFLFDLIGLDLTRGAEDEGPGEESLAAYLLRELREPTGERPEDGREG